jgi:uncharacterized repeat protein (TIGR01451 family)
MASLSLHGGFRGRISAYVIALSLLLAGVSILLAPLLAALAASATFGLRFTTNNNGDIVFVANTVTSCPTTAPECGPSQQGVGAKSDFLNNNFYSMVYVNVDTATPGLINSSSADLALPGSLSANQSVLFAGLYWGGRTTKTSRNQVLFRTPGAGYTTVTGALTGTPVPGSATTPEAYQMFANVTSIVQAAGAGTYTVANVQTDLGTDRYGAWGLVVVVRDPSQPPRNLTVFDGFGAVQTTGGNTTVDIGVSGFKTPPAGPVNARVGVIAYEGDLGFNGDTLQLASPPPNFKTLTDTLNPPDNFFNSTISRLGQRVTTKNPDFVNQLAFDADIVNATGIIPNSATSATLRLTTTGETYYPGVVTTAIDLFAPIVDVNKRMTDLNGGVLVPGDIVQVDITATNSGQDGASSMVLTDPIPANTTFVPGSLVVTSGPNAGAKSDAAGDDQAEFDTANNRVVFRLGSGANASTGGTLGPAGQSTSNSSVRFQVRVNPGTPGGSVISNVATAGFTGQTLGLPFTQSSPAATLTIAKPDVRILKNHTGDFTVGNPGVYTLTVSNQATGGPSNGPVTVTDTLPTGLTPAGATGTNWSCSIASQLVTCTWTGSTPVQPGTTLPAISLAVNPTLATTSVVNTATVNTPNEEDSTDNSSSDATRVLAATADLGISKTVTNPPLPLPYVAGGPITYRIVVDNGGPDSVTGAQVQDTLPAFLTGATWTCGSGTNGGACRAASGSGSINALVDLPNQATVTFTLTGTVAAGTTGAISNSVSVTPPTGVTDPFQVNNTSTEVDGAALNADLHLTKTHAPNPAVAGQALAFTLIATNSGPDPAPQARLQDPLVGPLSNFTWTCSATAGATCGSPNGSGSIDQTGSLPVGGQLQFTVTGTLPSNATDPIGNSAFVSPGGTVVDPHPETAAADDTVTPTISADMSVTKTTSASYVPGQPLTYNIVVHNAGPSDVTDAQIQDTVPASLANFHWTCTPDSGAACSVPGGTGSIDALVDIPAGENVTLVLTGSVPSATAGTLTNSASVTPATGSTDLIPGNNSSTSNTPANPVADLSVTKTGSPNPYMPGESLTYSIVVTNAGPSDVTGATVTDTISASLSQLAWTCDTTEGSACQASTGSGSLTNALVNLIAGGQATFTLTGIVDPAQTATIHDSVTVQPPGGTTDPAAGNNTATDQNPGGPRADLSITKRSSPNPYQAGQPLTYTLTVQNAGPADAPGTHVFDMMPPALASFTWSCQATPPSVCRTPSGTGNINPATIDLVAGGSATITLTGTLPDGTTGEINNVASVNPDPSIVDPSPGNDLDTDNNPTGAVADVAITKTSSPNPYVPGQPLVYSIVVSNSGPNDVGAEVVDSVPAPLQGFTWICTSATPGTECGQPSGSGSIDTIVSLPAGGSQTILLSGIAPDASAGTLSNTVTAGLPGEYVDPNLANNSATDSNAPASPAPSSGGGGRGGGSHPAPTPTPEAIVSVQAGGGGTGGAPQGAIAGATETPTGLPVPTPVEPTAAPTPVSPVMPPPPPPPVGVAGVVYDANTGAQIAGATVEVLDSDGSELAEVTADETGAFTFGDLAPWR